MRVLPDYSLDAAPPLDILVVPGGWGTRREIDNPRLTSWIAERGREVELLTSVCTGAVLLGKAGHLQGRRATTHFQALDWLRRLFPETRVEDALNVVEDGNVLTSAGISAGIDMALKVVSRCYGEAVARNAARNMEYPWPEDDRRRIDIG